MKNFARFVFVIFLFVCFLSAGAFFWYKKGISTSLGEGQGVTYYEVKEGATRDSVAAGLVELDYLDSPDFLVLYIRISGKGGRIQAGTHVFTAEMNIADVVEELERVPNEDTLWVTIPEGLRYDEIALVLDGAFESVVDRRKFDLNRFVEVAEDPSLGNFSPDVREFLDGNIEKGGSLEGFLFPDTYNLNVEIVADDALNILITTLMKKIGQDRLELIKNSDFDLFEVLTIASMVEREAFTKDEAHMIADIIIRRLDGGYFLGIDATSLYTLKNWKAVLTYKELESNDPYNTRNKLGLPPSPIANPGIQTIEAVLSPTKNSYLYYLHGKDGLIHYSKDNAGHESNKKYL